MNSKIKETSKIINFHLQIYNRIINHHLFNNSKLKINNNKTRIFRQTNNIKIEAI